MSAVKFSLDDYTLGLTCLKALWLNKRQPALASGGSRAKVWPDEGIKKIPYYQGGVRVKAPRWTTEAVAETTELAQAGRQAIYKAVASTPKGDYTAADILKPLPNGDFDLYTIKAASEVKGYYYPALAFQYYVFSSCFPIRRVFFLTINPRYARRGDIEPRKLFRKTEVTAEAIKQAAEISARLAA